MRLLRAVSLALVAVAAVLVTAGPAAADRSRLGFQSDRGPATAPFTQLYTMDANGRDIRPLLPHLPNSFDAAWSRDGRRLAYDTILDPGYFEVFVARGDGSNSRRVTSDTDDIHDGGPAWFPDGRQLAFVSDRTGSFEIYRAWPWPPFPVTPVTRNGANNCGCYDPFNTFSAPSVSPDGRRIAFTSDIAAPGVNLDIYVADVHGSGLRRLTSDPGIDAEADWSPDGRRIAFNSNRDGDDEIYVMDARGGRVRQLTHNTAQDRQPAWSPDGRRIAYASELSGADDIWVMRRNGTRQRDLTNDAAFDERPAWQPASDHDPE